MQEAHVCVCWGWHLEIWMCYTSTVTELCPPQHTSFLWRTAARAEQQQQSVSSVQLWHQTTSTHRNMLVICRLTAVRRACTPSSRKAFNKNIIHQDCFGTNSIKPLGYSWPTLAHSSVCAVANPVSFPPASTHLAVHSAGWRGPLVPPTYWWSCLGC